MKRLGLTKRDIDIFYEAFLKVDTSNQGSFLIEDLLMYLGIDPSPLVMGVFGELDLSTENTLNFREVAQYTIVLSNYSICLTCY